MATTSRYQRRQSRRLPQPFKTTKLHPFEHPNLPLKQLIRSPTTLQRHKPPKATPQQHATPRTEATITMVTDHRTTTPNTRLIRQLQLPSSSHQNLPVGCRQNAVQLVGRERLLEEPHTGSPKNSITSLSEVSTIERCTINDPPHRTGVGGKTSTRLTRAYSPGHIDTTKPNRCSSSRHASPGTPFVQRVPRKPHTPRHVGHGRPLEKSHLSNLNGVLSRLLQREACSRKRTTSKVTLQQELRWATTSWHHKPPPKDDNVDKQSRGELAAESVRRLRGGCLRLR